MCTMYKMFQTSAMIAFACISPQQYMLKIRTVHIFCVMMNTVYVLTVCLHSQVLG